MSASAAPWLRLSGEVCELSEGAVKVAGLSRFARLGDAVQLGEGALAGLGQVVRIEKSSVVVKPFAPRLSALLGTRAFYRGPVGVAPSHEWRGRALNAFGEAVDKRGALVSTCRTDPVSPRAPSPMTRRPVDEPFCTGIPALDIFTPLCRGQRIGIFAAAGLGKTSLLVQLAKAASVDQLVLCLVGERGREVGELHQAALEATKGTAVTVVATADESPLMRRLAAYTALAAVSIFGTVATMSC